MTITDNVQKIIKNAVQNDWISLDGHRAILLHTAVEDLHEILEFHLSLVAENVIEFLDKIPKRRSTDSDFQTWWIDAHEYITFYDWLRDNPEYYDELGGKKFFENRYKKWFKEHPFCPQAGIYYFNNEDTPTLDFAGDTLFDIYALFQDGSFDETIWKENFSPYLLIDEEVESLKHINIKNLTDTTPPVMPY